MNIKYNKKSILIAFIVIVVLAFAFLVIFLKNFQFSKKLACAIYSDQIFTLLLVDKSTDCFLKQNKSKTCSLEFENKTYKIQYTKHKQVNDYALYMTNTVFDTKKTNIGYFLVSNLNFKDFLN